MPVWLFSSAENLHYITYIYLWFVIKSGTAIISHEFLSGKSQLRIITTGKTIMAQLNLNFQIFWFFLDNQNSLIFTYKD